MSKENNNLKLAATEQYGKKIMKQTFIIKAHASIVRVAKQYILDSYHPWLWASDDDFSIVQFKTKKEMKEAFANIARPCGDTFYIDNENGATYIKVDAQSRETAKEFQYLASMITPHSQR